MLEHSSPRRRGAGALRLLVFALAALTLVPATGVLAADDTEPTVPTSENTTPPTDPVDTEPTTTTTTPTTTTTTTTTAPTTTTTPPSSTVPTTTTAAPVITAATAATVAIAPAAAPMVLAAAAPAAATSSTTTTTVPAPTCTVSMVVQLSTRGEPARCVEARLRQYGYWLQGPDFNFDTTAVTALKAFQTKRGLAATGVATEAVLRAMGIWTAPITRPAATCSTYVTVRLGVVGDPARCLETRLRQYGYWLRGPDANFDTTGVTALKAFQTRSGLLDDGIAGPATLRALGIWRQPPARPAVTCFTAITVKLGSTGFPARCVETRLRQYGYWLQGPNDRFDTTAVTALKAFQNREGLPATGIADSTTLVRLGVYRANQFPTATCKVHYAVRLGMTGDTARCVETRLRQLGYWLVGPNLTFDSTAVTALRNFQYKMGMAVDGVAGPITLQRLGIYDPVAPPYPPLPANSGTGRRVVYSRAQQRIWAVNADGTIAKSHRVSGRTFEPYAGTYYVYSRSLYTNSVNDPSVRWRYMIRFTYGPQGGRIGFHEIPNRNGVPLQSAEQLGLPLSGGCVRQSTADAAWLWNWAPVGTKVVVL